MSVYSVDKLVSEARRLAREYREATGKTLPITAEIAINDAIRHLQLTPAVKGEHGFDALMTRGDDTLKLQIKGRVIFDKEKSGHRLGQLRTDQPWDAIILVIMDSEFEPVEMYLAYRDDILEIIDKSKNRKGSMTVTRFKNMGVLVWSRENGLEDDGYWSNVS